MFAERGADLHELLAEYNPANTRGSFLVDTGGAVRYAWVAPDITILPDPDELLAAAREHVSG